jgi:hypothetical protein
MRPLLVALLLAVGAPASANRDVRVGYIDKIIASTRAYNRMAKLAGQKPRRVPTAKALLKKFERDAGKRWRAEVREVGDRFEAWIVHANGEQDKEGSYAEQMRAVWAAGDYANMQNLHNPLGKTSGIPGR